jgi:single-strand DNA-binding protein
MSDINSVTLVGRLTADPELRALPSGSSVCKLRLASSTSHKQGDEWVDLPNYFDVTVWNGQGEAAAKHLSKGRAVAINGRLEWREWEAQDGTKRQAIQIVADQVQFLPAGKPTESAPEPEAEQPTATGRGKRGSRKAKASEPEPVAAGVAAGEGGDDIPF